MTLYRLLAAFVVFFFSQSTTRLAAQDYLDFGVTEFAIRASSPCLPFPVANTSAPLLHPLDDQGQALPINQCKVEYLASEMDRCGFSAGQQYSPNLDTQLAETENEIDLSPLSFDCMEVGCEVETMVTVESKEKAIEAVRNPDELLTKSEIKRIISEVFSRDLTLDLSEESEVAESNVHVKANSKETWDASAYDPYVDPSHGLAKTGHTTILSGMSLREFSDLAQFWSIVVVENAAQIEPMDLVRNKVNQLEADWCGSPVLHLAYAINAEISMANQELIEQKDFENRMAEVEKNALVVAGFAQACRVLGVSLIEISDTVSTINAKKVEAAQTIR